MGEDFTLIRRIFVFSFLLLPLISVAGPKKIDPVKHSAVLDTSKSHVVWTGAKASGGHSEKILFKSGRFEFKRNTLSGGEIVADLKNITDENLKNLLDVAKHPVAKFRILSGNELHNIVAGQPNVEVHGKLKIRGVQVPLSAQVMFEPVGGGAFEVKGRIRIGSSGQLDLNLVARR